MSIPFHKQTDPKKQAGQHRYGFDREPYLKHSNVAPDVTLSDYITRKTECCGNPLRGCKDCPPPKKITFDEWFAKNEDEVNDEYTNGENSFKFIWNAALKEGKL